MQLIICLLIQDIKGFSNKYYVDYKTQKFRFSFFPDILYGTTQTTTTTALFYKQFVRFKLQVCFCTNSSFLPPQNTIQLMTSSFYKPFISQFCEENLHNCSLLVYNGGESAEQETKTRSNTFEGA